MTSMAILYQSIEDTAPVRPVFGQVCSCLFLRFLLPRKLFVHGSPFFLRILALVRVNPKLKNGSLTLLPIRSHFR